MKKTRIVLIILTLGQSLFIGTGCNDKPPCHCDEITEISDSMKTFTKFGDGTFWVYRLDEDTSNFDTLSLLYTSIKTNDCLSDKFHGDPCSNHTTYRLQHSNLEYFPLKFNNEVVAGYELQYSFSVGKSEEYHLERYVTNRTSNGPIFALPVINPQSIIPLAAYEARKLESIEIQNILYQDVILSNLVVDSAVKTHIDSIYIASNVGIIKYKNDFNQHWSLMQFNPI